jgi:hypothetical protein
MKVNEYIKRLKTARNMLVTSLEEIAEWRERAHSYDEDCGHQPRQFDKEEVQAIEAFAANVLAEYRQKKGSLG